jgi:hypothetical protein
VVPPPDDHDCGWKGWATDLAQRLAETEAKLAAIERRVLGPKSEKLPKVPPMDREVAKKRPPDPAATQAKRRKNAELRATRVVTEDVPPDRQNLHAPRNSPLAVGRHPSALQRKNGPDLRSSLPGHLSDDQVFALARLGILWVIKVRLR